MAPSWRGERAERGCGLSGISQDLARFSFFFHKDSYRDSSLILILDFDLDSDVGFDLDLIWIRF